MYCKECHTEMHEDWKFCPFCGEPNGSLNREDDMRRVITFAELYERWMESYRNKIGDATRYCYQAAKKYFTALDQVRFCMIDLEDLQSCIDQCPRGKRTRENMKALACLMYRYALPRHISDQNYAQFLDTGLGEKNTRNAFNEQEIIAIRKGIPAVKYADEIMVMIYTGFRPCEMLELRKESFKQLDGVWCLVGGRKTAAGKNRVVTLNSALIPILERRMKLDSDYLFPNRKGKKMSVKYFREYHFYPALEELGIQMIPAKESHPRLTPYSCRHTFSDLIKKTQGADRDKAALMGHADYKTTRTMYQSSCVRDCKEITDQLFLDAFLNSRGEMPKVSRKTSAK